MKKLFTLIVAICATTLAWSAEGDYGFCGENVRYRFVNSTGTLTIYGTGAMYGYNNWNLPWNAYSSSIKKVVIEDGVESIGYGAFENCSKLTSVEIPNSVTSIGWSAFLGCNGLTSITIPNSVTSIGECAFFNCTGLTSITIPNSVTSIGSEAFFCCTGLTSITIPNSVTSIGSQAFIGCTGLTSINVAEDNLNYALIDGVLYSKDKKTLIMCPPGKTGSVTIPNSVTSIGEGAFDGCEGLTSMTVEATYPPLCVNEYGYGLGMPNYNIPLYVPAGSVNAYKAAEEWKDFTNIQAIPGTGVNEATVENTVEKSEVKKIIDRNGIIYIEKDGTRYFLNGSKVK